MKEFYTKSEISVFLDEFYSLYNERPVKDNTGGMKASHMFAFWFLLKKINPEAVIESGVFNFDFRKIPLYHVLDISI